MQNAMVRAQKAIIYVSNVVTKHPIDTYGWATESLGMVYEGDELVVTRHCADPGPCDLWVTIKNRPPHQTVAWQSKHMIAYGQVCELPTMPCSQCHNDVLGHDYLCYRCRHESV